jgi:hypothetical protein
MAAKVGPDKAGRDHHGITGRHPYPGEDIRGKLD